MELKMKPNIKEMKEIIYGIIEEERRHYQIEINASPITIVEYYKTTTFENKLKLTNPIGKFILMIQPFWFGGWYDINTKNIFVFLNHYHEKINKISLADLINTGYHEARHRYQDKVILPKREYQSFLMNIEQIILPSLPGHQYYITHHDNFLLEIDANNYAIHKTIDYLKKNPQEYQKYQKYLEKRQKKCQYDYLVYNPRKTFEILNLMLKEYPDRVLKGCSILSVFYNSNGTFKSISTILNNDELNSIDKRIINIVLSSEAFTNQLDLDKLNDEERKYIINVLNDTYQEEIKRQQYKEIYNENHKNLKQELMDKKDLLEIIRYLDKTLSKLLYLPIEKKEELKSKAYYEKIEEILKENNHKLH